MINFFDVRIINQSEKPEEVPRTIASDVQEKRSGAELKFDFWNVAFREAEKKENAELAAITGNSGSRLFSLSADRN